MSAEPGEANEWVAQLTRAELSSVLAWYVTAEEEGTTDDADDALFARLDKKAAARLDVHE